jgi:hypothetical protein
MLKPGRADDLLRRVLGPLGVYLMVISDLPRSISIAMLMTVLMRDVGLCISAEFNFCPARDVVVSLTT